MRHSQQRDAILRVLRASRAHPTAEHIYAEVRKVLPNVSLGTVYRNIRQLSESGELITLETEDKSVHYDGNTAPHRHFVCNRCHRILDLFFDVPLPPELVALGFAVESEKCIYYGLCSDCAQNHPPAVPQIATQSNE